MKNNLRIYIKLFTSTFLISAFTFGGGFVIISIMKKKFVEQYHWLEEDEMLDLSAIAQSAPGALAINVAFVVGYRIKKLSGALISVLGTVIPPLIIISVISLFYDQFRTNQMIAVSLQVMRAGVAAVIFDVVINLATNIIQTRNILNIILMILSYIAAYFIGISAVIIITICILIGLGTALLHKKRKESK